MRIICSLLLLIYAVFGHATPIPSKISGKVTGTASQGVVIKGHGGNVATYQNRNGPITVNGARSSHSNTASNNGNNNGNGGGTNNGNDNGSSNIVRRTTDSGPSFTTAAARQRWTAPRRWQFWGRSRAKPAFSGRWWANGIGNGNFNGNGSPNGYSGRNGNGNGNGNGIGNGNFNGNFNNNANAFAWPFFGNNWIQNWNRFWGLGNSAATWRRFVPQQRTTGSTAVRRTSTNGVGNGNGSGMFNGNFNGNFNGR